MTVALALAMGFASLNSGQRVTLRLGLFTLYGVPLNFASQDIVAKLVSKLRLGVPSRPPPMTFPTLDDYKRYSVFLQQRDAPEVTICFVGKYLSAGADAYFSVLQAFEHAALFLEVRIKFIWIDARNDDAMALLERHVPTCDGVFVAGEMLDWEAPTGGYLLQACFASGRAAGKGAAAWVSLKPSS